MSGWSAGTIRRLMKVNDFPEAVRLSPKRIVWLRDDLDRWLDAKAGREVSASASIFRDG